MSIVQEVIDRKGNMTGKTFADLAHMPFVTPPDSIDGITEEWFNEQRDFIEGKIASFEKSNTSTSAREYSIGRLRSRIDFLRKFTDEVLKERAEMQKQDEKTVMPSEPQKTEYQRQQEYDEYVDGLLKKAEKDRKLARDLEYFKNQ